MGNPRNSKSQIELSLERELDVLVKVSISLQSEFDPESLFSVILVKVSISLQSEFDAEVGPGSHIRRRGPPLGASIGAVEVKRSSPGP